jgi:hypothetical protein
MKSPVLPLLAAFLVTSHGADVQTRLEITKTRDAAPAVRWQADVPRIVGARAEYSLHSSSNFANWWRAADPVKVSDTSAVEVPVATGGDHRFFRLQRNVLFDEPEDAGAEAFGFSGNYAAELARLGQISTEEFAARYPGPSNYLGQISFDPTTAEFWTNWNMDPAVYNASLEPTNTDRRLWDFRLNERELATFKKLGFVVSERLGTTSFGDMMYRIYNDDLPVFVSADAILQAWHRTYAGMLQELEETYFYNEWKAVLQKMADRLPALYETHGNGSLKTAILDADYFVAVALSLANGTNTPSRLSQDARVAETLEQIKQEQLVEFPLFGSCRRVDFSQFKPRSHYEESYWLQRYFQLVMWLGRIEFRITPAQADISCNENDPSREFASSALLYFLLQESGGFESWSQMNAVINVFVGEPDSMNFAELGALLKAAEINSAGDLEIAANFTRLNEMLKAGDFGVQEIMSDTYDRPNGKLPRSFTVFGQRFVPDSWALGKVVFDNIRWDGAGNFEDGKPRRFLPLSLDVAFGVLGNNAAVPQIIAQIQTKDGHPARDGFPYQHNLAAVRHVIDLQPEAFWKQNIYNYWLAALRALSEPTTGENFPQAMRTHAWGIKTVNTQLGSWTHLRHDTVLYAKQSYSSAILCSYPKAYVEPVPKFWGAMKAMASSAAEMIGGLHLAERTNLYYRWPQSQSWPVRFDSKAIQSNQARFLQSFAERMALLEEIARRELAHEELSAEQIEALQNIVEIQRQYEGRRFTGWYPGLFYKNCFFDGSFEEKFYHQTQGCDRMDLIVTDVHTAPSPPEPGYVLHQAVGLVNFLLIAVDCGAEQPIVYGGPVLSHYEMPTEGLKRMSDSDWMSLFFTNLRPAPTPWTAEYLVRQ